MALTHCSQLGPPTNAWHAPFATCLHPAETSVHQVLASTDEPFPTDHNCTVKKASGAVAAGGGDKPVAAGAPRPCAPGCCHIHVSRTSDVGAVAVRALHEPLHAVSRCRGGAAVEPAAGAGVADVWPVWCRARGRRRRRRRKGCTPLASTSLSRTAEPTRSSAHGQRELRAPAPGPLLASTPAFLRTCPPARRLGPRPAPIAGAQMQGVWAREVLGLRVAGTSASRGEQTRCRAEGPRARCERYNRNFVD